MALRAGCLADRLPKLADEFGYNSRVVLVIVIANAHKTHILAQLSHG